MKAIIDLVLLGILVICVWNGYKKGIIMGVGGILCIIIAIYGANLLANTFYHDLVPAMKPFANGFTESISTSTSLELFSSAIARTINEVEIEMSI